MSNIQDKEKEVEKTADAQAADGSVFGAIESYASDYNKILDQSDEYLLNNYNTQKQKAEQSYTQEKSAAYTDYQKQVDPYGVQAEQLASSGLSNSGYAESLKTQAYVAYQNRQAVAHQSYQDALVSYNNAFAEAKMQNDSQRAALAFQTFQMQLESIISMYTGGYGSIMNSVTSAMQYAKEDPAKWEQTLKTLTDYANGKKPDGATMSAVTGIGSYDEAVAILENYGISETPLSRAEWRKNKEGYESYKKYLIGFVTQQVGFN